MGYTAALPVTALSYDAVRTSLQQGPRAPRAVARVATVRPAAARPPVQAQRLHGLAQTWMPTVSWWPRRGLGQDLPVWSEDPTAGPEEFANVPAIVGPSAWSGITVEAATPWVQSVFEEILGRAPTEVEQSRYVNRLVTGAMTFDQVLSDIAVPRARPSALPWGWILGAGGVGLLALAGLAALGAPVAGRRSGAVYRAGRAAWASA